MLHLDVAESTTWHLMHMIRTGTGARHAVRWHKLMSQIESMNTLRLVTTLALPPKRAQQRPLLGTLLPSKRCVATCARSPPAQPPTWHHLAIITHEPVLQPSFLLGTSPSERCPATSTKISSSLAPYLAPLSPTERCLHVPSLLPLLGNPSPSEWCAATCSRSPQAYSNLLGTPSPLKRRAATGSRSPPVQPPTWNPPAIIEVCRYIDQSLLHSLAIIEVCRYTFESLLHPSPIVVGTSAPSSKNAATCSRSSRGDKSAARAHVCFQWGAARPCDPCSYPEKVALCCAKRDLWNPVQPRRQG